MSSTFNQLIVETAVRAAFTIRTRYTFKNVFAYRGTPPALRPSVLPLSLSILLCAPLLPLLPPLTPSPPLPL